MTCGIIGKDPPGRRLLHELMLSGASIAGVVTSKTVFTTSKTRIIAHNQQVVRLDREHTTELESQLQARVRAFVRKSVLNC